jgi:hypothetical protein
MLRGRTCLRVQAYFFQNSCQYMMIIYVITNLGEMSNWLRKYGNANTTRLQIHKIHNWSMQLLPLTK